jgi:predicted dehydrogenase
VKQNNFSRREFLGITAAAAGGTLASKTILLTPDHVQSASRPVAPSDKVRFGMIGVGMQGSGLLGTSITLPGVECAGAADLYDGRHVLAREIVRPDLPVTRRYKELLANKDIDCIVAAVPDHWHRQVVIDAVSAGKDIYCEKPMSHTAADGVAMVDAAKKSGRTVQIGSQRISSLVCAKAKEIVSQGMLGDLMLVEGWLGRNDPTGAWQYPPPFDLSPQNLDWDTWQGDVPKRPFDPIIFARWRCWKEYGTGVAGDLLVHLISGMMFMLGINEPPKQASAVGGIRHWKDGRNMPDVHSTVYYY